MSKNNDFWRNKLIAFLHDPPNKQQFVCRREDHEEYSIKLLNYILPPITESSLNDSIVNISDVFASGISRIIIMPPFKRGEEKKKEQFKKKIEVREEKDIYFIDPFSKRKTLKILEEIDEKEIEEFFRRVGDGEINFENEEERAKLSLLFLWRYLPKKFLWILNHPADSRCPNHSIYDHNSQTSALYTVLQKSDKIGILLFSISPVQKFIQNARKLQDLWSGSYILSYLIWCGIRYIVENLKLGPDVIIYPHLLGNPLFDFEVKEPFSRFKNKFPELVELPNTNLQIASLPNRFLSFIPYDEDIPKQIEDEIRNCIKNFAEKLKDILPPEAKHYIEENKIKEAVNHYFQIYWSLVEIPLGDYNQILENYENLNREDTLYNVCDYLLKHYIESDRNPGIFYPIHQKLTETTLSLRKSIRNFQTFPFQKSKYKCSICGEYDVVSEDDKFWEILSEKMPGSIKYGKYGDSVERLCGICLLKRFFPYIIYDIMSKPKEMENISFPSTAEIASIPFKKTLKENNNLKNKFIEKFKELILNSINNEEKKKIFFTNASPIECLQVESKEIDGQWLMEENYDKEYLKRHYGITEIENLEKMKEFLRENKITPSHYYGILMMDGDNIGKWLSGEKMPKIRELLHHKVVDELEKEEANYPELETVLNYKHPMTPSFHSAFSRKLSTFGIEKVPEKIGKDGKLIYCGGDDLLAFVGIGTLLSISFKIQEEFKNWMGKDFSMSAGIVIAHYKLPLKIVLEEVRDAEKKAKNLFGRNAFCIKVLAHSGEWRFTGGKWDIMKDFENLIEDFEQEKIPGTLPYQFAESVKILTSDRNEIGEEELKELLTCELKRIVKKKEKAEIWEEISEIFENYYKQILEIGKNLGDEKKLNPFEMFANLLIFSKFIASKRIKRGVSND